MSATDPYSFSVVNDGSSMAEFGCCQDTSLAKVAPSGTNALHPEGEEPDLGKRVKLGDLEPIKAEDCIERRMNSIALAQFLQYDPSRPAFPANKEFTQDIEALCSREVNQAHGVECEDLIGAPGDSHGPTSASSRSGRSVSLIWPCISSTTLARVMRP